MVKIISGISYDKNDILTKMDKNYIRIIRSGNIQNSRLILFDDDIFLPVFYKNNIKMLHYNDIVIMASTGSKNLIGKPAFVEEQLDNVYIGAFLRIIRPNINNIFDYLKLIFMSEYYRSEIRKNVNGTNINNVNSNILLNMLIPIPSIKNERKISKKIYQVLNILTLM
ncbi:restriction endonuclease subunit S [Mycoplasmopsis fermentans]|uniref:restriction endonuclease subunit S n=1 Tax=Mycoplasmopsis fermentans TaxID=2115 RepID=UPI00130545ED|nr:restriction endonuclease subunit S [Mycoplasmopsis fermentans]